MKRVWLHLSAFALLFSGMASAVTIASINNGTGSNCGIGCFQIGDKRFTNLNITGLDPTEGTWTTADVDVNGSVGADSTVFISFNLPATAGDGGPNQMVDFNLLYTVTVVGNQLISTIDQLIVGTAGMTGGFARVTEQVFNNPITMQLANSNVTIPGDPTDPNAEGNDVLVLSTPVSSANVIKDVLLTAGNSADRLTRLTDLTLIQQSFHQIPEPIHYSLLLSAGLMVGLYFKSKRSSEA